jgi:hypothetical protein
MISSWKETASSEAVLFRKNKKTARDARGDDERFPLLPTDDLAQNQTWRRRTQALLAGIPPGEKNVEN